MGVEWPELTMGEGAMAALPGGTTVWWGIDEDEGANVGSDGGGWGRK